jgi:hypothetical protein
MLHWCCFVYPGCRFYVALVLFCLSRLSLLCCTGAVLSIQVVFFMLHWCSFVYPGCLLYVALVLFCLCRLSFLCCTGAVLSIEVVFFMLETKQHQSSITKTTLIDKTAPMQHKNDNLNRQNSTSAA